MRSCLPLVLMFGVGCGWIPSGHAAVSPELQKAIRANTFEVVIKKPLVDTATYEKPLPLELLPFHERNDAYRSVGTAFALGHNTYVTAAHVFNLAVDSQFGAPELRTADSSVYPVDRILRYSQHEDYVGEVVQRSRADGGVEQTVPERQRLHRGTGEVHVGQMFPLDITRAPPQHAHADIDAKNGS